MMSIEQHDPAKQLDVEYNAKWSCYKCGRTILKYNTKFEPPAKQRDDSDGHADKPPYEHKCKCGAWNYKRLDTL